jgi:two-component system sensor kinase FixL
MFGFGADEVIGRNVNCLMPAPDRERHNDYIARYLRTGEKRIIGIGREVHAKRRDGTSFPVELAVGEVIADGHRLFAGFLRDISARRDAEQRVLELHSALLHVSRLSEMGEMASALAHELNQPLTAMMNYMQACRRMLPQDAGAPIQRVAELMEKSISQGERAGQIIRHLRRFIARGETEHSAEEISSVVEEAAHLALIGASERDITAVFDLAHDLPPVLIDRIQIQQVIINLVRNSVDALAETGPGEITVRTARTAPDMVQIEVRDTGPGIDEEVARRLFQPFVTTKPGGLGIGLSICRTIVEAHEGRLWATSNPGGGTTFHLTLPLRSEGRRDGS